MSRSFKDTAPREFICLPKQLASNNDLSMTVDDIMEYAAMTTLERTPGMSATEYAARVLDEYAQTPHGRKYLSTVDDISYRLGASFSQAYDILLNHIAPTIEKITVNMDREANNFLAKLTNYSGKHAGKSPKMYLLDVEHLYHEYKTSAQDFANYLCSKYHYGVEYLNDSNVIGLINRIKGVSDLSINRSALEAIMEDVTIKISSDTNGDVVINTNHQDDVVVDGATPNVVKEDDQSSVEVGDPDPNTQDCGLDGENCSDSEATSADSSSEEGETVIDGNANVTVKTGDNDANVNVTINDEKVTAEDKELAADIVRACFDSQRFELLKNKLFVGKGHVQHTHLLRVLKFIRKDIRTLIEERAADYLSPIEMEMLYDNLDKVNELQKAGIIYLDINSVQFAETIIIGPTLLNKNLVNRALSDGINVIPLIKNYLRVYHNTNKDDLYYNHTEHRDIGQGVTYEKLMSTSYAVDQVLVNAKEATKKEYSRQLKKIRIDSFHKAVSSYVRELAETASEDQLKVSENNKIAFLRYCDERIHQFCQQLEMDPNANAEDMIYQLVVGRWYAGTLVGEIYNRLQEHIKDKASRSTLNAEAMAMIKAEIIAELGADYIFKTFIWNA